MSDPVDHPPHYNAHPSGIECIEIVRHMGFNLGNVVKYVWRADEKGAELEDLRKAAWYLADEIARRQNGGQPLGPAAQRYLQQLSSSTVTCSEAGCSNPPNSQKFVGQCTEHEPF